MDVAAGEQGALPERWGGSAFRDIVAVEWLSWVPLLVLIFVLGLFPSLVLNTTESGVNASTGIFGA